MANNPNNKYIKQIQSGCAVKIYHNGPNAGKTTKLFFEIKKCTTNRSIKDIGGGFTLYLHPTQPWDDIIKGDDYIRIFYGDELSNANDLSYSYNIASQDSPLDVLPDVLKSKLEIPLSGSGWSYEDDRVIYNNSAEAPKTLTMYERFFGKIDRVQRIARGPGKNQGTSVHYAVTGRFFGAMLQDIILQYNDFIPGFNAINMWARQTADTVEKRPDELVYLYLENLLAVTPMPQFQLPYPLILDYMDPEEIVARGEEIAKNVTSMINQLSEAMISTKPTVEAFKRLNSLISNAKDMIANSPLMIISLLNMEHTHGINYDTSWLTNMSSSSYDFLKYLSNPQFNEFYCDMLPAGLNEGTAESDYVYPSFVMRQRPYDIDPVMLSGLANSVDISGYVEPPDVASKLSLLDLINDAVVIFGPATKENEFNETYKQNSVIMNEREGEDFYEPTMMDYQMGYTSISRFNSYLCLNAFASGSGEGGGAKLLLAEIGGYIIDTDSIAKYGFRSMETTTQYASPSGESDSYLQNMVDFTKMLANWYCLNPSLMDGVMTCRFLKKARLGIPCVYIETRKTPSNPYPKLELSYIQSIQDDYEYGKPITTTLTLTRGLRYDLTKSWEEALLEEAIK